MRVPIWTNQDKLKGKVAKIPFEKLIKTAMGQVKVVVRDLKVVRSFDIAYLTHFQDYLKYLLSNSI